MEVHDQTPPVTRQHAGHRAFQLRVVRVVLGVQKGLEFCGGLGAPERLQGG